MESLGIFFFFDDDMISGKQEIMGIVNLFNKLYEEIEYLYVIEGYFI